MKGVVTVESYSFVNSFVEAARTPLGRIVTGSDIVYAAQEHSVWWCLQTAERHGTLPACALILLPGTIAWC